MLSTYLNDMNVLRIESITKLNKSIGNVLINLRRYIIDGCISEFNETFSMIDNSKKKIGELLVYLKL